MGPSTTFDPAFVGKTAALSKCALGRVEAPTDLHPAGGVQHSIGPLVRLRTKSREDLMKWRPLSISSLKNEQVLLQGVPP